MSVTIEITQRGVYRNGQMIPVGEKLTLDREPTGWVNKYRLVSDGDGKTLEVASPAPPAPEPPLARDVTGGKRRGRPKKIDEDDGEG